MLALALAGVVVALGILSGAGCGDDARDPEPTPAAADSFAEFIVATNGGFIFERVDRATPEPLEANQGETCFTDPARAYNGAPYDRGDSLTQLPTGTERGEVNVMHQCVLAGRTYLPVRLGMCR